MSMTEEPKQPRKIIEYDDQSSELVSAARAFIKETFDVVKNGIVVVTLFSIFYARIENTFVLHFAGALMLMLVVYICLIPMRYKFNFFEDEEKNVNVKTMIFICYFVIVTAVITNIAVILARTLAKWPPPY